MSVSSPTVIPPLFEVNPVIDKDSVLANVDYIPTSKASAAIKVIKGVLEEVDSRDILGVQFEFEITEADIVQIQQMYPRTGLEAVAFHQFPWEDYRINARQYDLWKAYRASLARSNQAVADGATVPATDVPPVWNRDP